MLNKVQRITLVGVASMLAFASITASAANCERRVRNAELQLQRAVARHGANSRQAEKKRRHLEEVRATCYRR